MTKTASPPGPCAHRFILRLLLFFFFLGAAQGCMVEPATPYHIDEALAGNTQLFEKIYGTRVTVTAMFTDNMPPDEFGLCKYYGKNDRRNIIYINRAWWDQADFYSRQQLMFHEMGHCVLGLKHKEGLTALGQYVNAPASIMYAMPFGEYGVYRENLQYYWNELNSERPVAERTW